MKRFVFILVIVSMRICGFAQVSWQEGMREMDLGRKVFFFEDKSRAMTIHDASAAFNDHQFHASKQRILHFGFSQSAYWIALPLSNPTDQQLVLEIAQAFLPNADLYYRDSTGNWQIIQSGYATGMAKKPVKYHYQVFPLPGGPHIFFVRFISYTHPVPLRLWDHHAFELASERQVLSYGVYSGILFFVIIINLFLFFALRKWYYLHYAVLVFLYLFTAAAVMEGFIVYVLPKTDLMQWYTFIPALNMPVLLSYCISFLQVKKYRPALYRFGVIATIYFCLYLLWSRFLPLLTLLFLNQLHALALFFIVAAIGLMTGRKGNRLGYYFAAAYTVWFLLVALEAIYIQTAKPRYIFGFSYVSMAIFTEVFLLAYLLSRRFEWERKAEQQRRLAIEMDLHRIQQQYQQEILQSKIEIQENTFNNISQEIHDNIGQILSLAKLHLSTLNWNDRTEMQEKLSDAREQVGRAIVDLRDLSRTMSSEAIQSMGFSHALRTELELIEKWGLLQVCFDEKGPAAEMDAQKSLILFRMAQEAFHNILKHAQAKELLVELVHTHKMLLMRIEDDGCGFDPKAGSKGNGLRNMMSRAQLIGAVLQISSRSGEGTRIEINLPLN